jgi:hypothetical protein
MKKAVVKKSERAAARTAARTGRSSEGYDFAQGVRGKYAVRYTAGSTTVVLDPDVAAAFPTARAVNDALRALLRLAVRQAGRKATRR